MSKIGKMPITIKEGVTVTIADRVVTVTGPKGTMSYTLLAGVNAVTEEGKLVVTQVEKTKDQTKAIFGLTRALLSNMVTGVSTGFEKKLELSGVGYRVAMAGADISLSVGFSHPVKIKAEPGITFTIKDNGIIVSGMDKALVGNTAAVIRAIRPPEPYKGKGIKYAGEKIRRKAGKAAKAVGGK
jgi:large subunit ribosomal protein L6